MMTKKGVPGIVPPPESFGLTPVSMELKWQPATIINGAPLTHYVIQQREGDDAMLCVPLRLIGLTSD